jgi:hypothetical protein
MSRSLHEIIEQHREALADAIAKAAIRQIPSYEEAPLSQTLERVDRWLRILAASAKENDPRILEGYLMGVAEERRIEGYGVDELHAVARLTEAEIRRQIQATDASQTEKNGLQALLAAIMGAARMVISVNFIMRVSDV